MRQQDQAPKRVSYQVSVQGQIIHGELLLKSNVVDLNKAQLLVSSEFPGTKLVFLNKHETDHTVTYHFKGE